MRNQLRFGRGLDNRRYKASGFEYGYTSRETVLRSPSTCACIRSCAGDGEQGYTYEREVEGFLRRSPHVRRERATDGVAAEREPLGI